MDGILTRDKSASAPADIGPGRPTKAAPGHDGARPCPHVAGTPIRERPLRRALRLPLVAMAWAASTALVAPTVAVAGSGSTDVTVQGVQQLSEPVGRLAQTGVGTGAWGMVCVGAALVLAAGAVLAACGGRD